jgi:hypothetical protein
VPLSRACNGQQRCEYGVDYTLLGDPVPGCGKEFAVDWYCHQTGAPYVLYRQVLRGEAGFGARLELTCDGEGRPGPVDPPMDLGPMQVVAATYGQSGGVPERNATTPAGEGVRRPRSLRLPGRPHGAGRSPEGLREERTRRNRLKFAPSPSAGSCLRAR